MKRRGHANSAFQPALSESTCMLSFHSNKRVSVLKSYFFRIFFFTSHPVRCTGPGSHQCSTCIAGFTMSGGRCTSTCSEGLYNDKDLNYCKPCHVSCLNCTGESCSVRALVVESAQSAHSENHVSSAQL